MRALAQEPQDSAHFRVPVLAQEPAHLRVLVQAQGPQEPAHLRVLVLAQEPQEPAQKPGHLRVRERLRVPLME